jgi:hypothetical protein
MGIEATLYGDVITAVQKDIADIWTTPELKMRSLFVYLTLYPLLIFLYIRFILPSASYFELFLTGFIIYYVADMNIFSLYLRADKYFWHLLLDSILVGGFGLLIPSYLVTMYGSKLQGLLPFLVVVFGLSFWFVTYRVSSYTYGKKKELSSRTQ